MKIKLIIIVFTLLIGSLLAIGQIRINMQKEGGVYKIPCVVNGLKLNFIFDTGASNVCISLSEANFMLKNNYLSENDIIGASLNQLANGEITKSTTILLKEIVIAGIKIYNIKASVINNANAPLLLGQSAMSKLGNFQIDPLNGILTVYSNDTKEVQLTPINNNDEKVIADNKCKSEIIVFNQVIKSNPKNEKAYFKRGLLKKQIGDHQGAINDFTKAINFNPKNIEYYKSRGYSKTCINDENGAIADFTKAIELNPSDAEAYYGKGMANFNSNDSIAILDFTKAIDLNPVYAEAYNDRGNLKSNLKDYNGAKDDYTKALEIKITAETLESRGYIKYLLDDYHGAIEDLTWAIQRNPFLASAYSDRGDAKFELDDYYGALADYTKAIELYPSNGDNYSRRGKVRFQLKNYDGALDDYTKAIEIFPYTSNYYYHRGLIFIIDDQKERGCLDLSKAGELGYNEAYKAMKEFCK
jgi:clan AA aspartic protease (TIGR02281 family)